jgi:hypothetical protein
MSTNRTISFANKLSLNQAAAFISACGTSVRPFLVGEPGIGKSSIMAAMEKRYGDSYNYAYIDCSNLDLGDVAMPVVDHETRTTRYYPNARFRLTEGKPVIIMLDEFTKAAEPIKNMLHPLLESRNARLGDVPLPEGSIVFLTGNLTSDGVGDSLKGHTLNRITRVEVGKPSADEWLLWAVEAGIHPVVLAWTKQFPHCLSSYTEGDQDENPYIYNPKKFQLSYVSPRSLELASRIVAQREHFDTDTLIAALAGTIGESAARDMQAFIAYQDELPTRERIIQTPKDAPIPTSAGATAVLVFSMIAAVEADNINPIMEYTSRLEPEWQAVFCISLAKNPAKQGIAMRARAFSDWAVKNQDLL